MSKRAAEGPPSPPPERADPREYLVEDTFAIVNTFLTLRDVVALEMSGRGAVTRDNKLKALRQAILDTFELVWGDLQEATHPKNGDTLFSHCMRTFIESQPSLTKPGNGKPVYTIQTKGSMGKLITHHVRVGIPTKAYTRDELQTIVARCTDVAALSTLYRDLLHAFATFFAELLPTVLDPDDPLIELNILWTNDEGADVLLFQLQQQDVIVQIPGVTPYSTTIRGWVLARMHSLYPMDKAEHATLQQGPQMGTTQDSASWVPFFKWLITRHSLTIKLERFFSSSRIMEQLTWEDGFFGWEDVDLDA